MKFVVRSEATRQHIIETSAELINKKGYAGTSITDLEKVTGLTKGSIYGNFENKEAICLAVLDYNINQKRNLMLEKVNQCTTFKDKLLTHIKVYQSNSKVAFLSGGCPLLNTTMEADDTNDELRKIAGKGVSVWIQDIADTIDGGIKANEFKPDTNAVEVALQIISVIEGASFFFRSTQDMKYVNTIMNTGSKIIESICV